MSAAMESTASPMAPAGLLIRENASATIFCVGPHRRLLASDRI